VEIIRHNEQMFAPFFVPYAGSGFIGLLKPMNSNQRLWMAHPHKAEQEGKSFTDEDVAGMRSCLVVVRQAYAAFCQKYKSAAA
jgi:hypothetical protein